MWKQIFLVSIFDGSEYDQYLESIGRIDTFIFAICLNNTTSLDYLPD